MESTSGGPLTSARMAHRILINQYLFATHLVEVDNLIGAGEETRTLMVAHMSLNHACLPIPPHPRIGRIVPRRIKCVFVYSEVNALLKRLR